MLSGHFKYMECFKGIRNNAYPPVLKYCFMQKKQNKKHPHPYVHLQAEHSPVLLGLQSVGV